MITAIGKNSPTYLSEDLSQALENVGISLPVHTQEKLLVYLALLNKWNLVFNLSGIKDPKQMLASHLLDCLVVVPLVGVYLRNNQTRFLADVGSGAGLPGIPIALACPDLEVTLIESNQKKTAFLTQAKIELGLDNVRILAQRIETVQIVFDAVISRAFSSLKNYVRLSAHLLSSTEGKQSCLMAMIAKKCEQPPEGWWIAAQYRLQVPGGVKNRHLIILQPN